MITARASELQMPQKMLGRTGISCSALGLGTVKFGRDQQVKYPWQFKIPDDKSIKNLFAFAKDLGINLVDTAPAYGNSEQRIGQLLERRQDWVICSKVGEHFINDVSLYDFSTKSCINSIDQSLKRLKTDYIDIILVHSDGNDENIIFQTDIFECLDKLKQTGKIRAFGMSSKTSEGGLWCVENTDVVMATRNENDHTDDEVLQRALALNTGVLIKKGLLSGHADQRAGGKGIEHAINYVFSHPAVNTLITGTISQNHLQENFEMVMSALSAAKNPTMT